MQRLAKEAVHRAQLARGDTSLWFVQRCDKKPERNDLFALIDLDWLKYVKVLFWTC